MYDFLAETELVRAVTGVSSAIRALLHHRVTGSRPGPQVDHLLSPPTDSETDLAIKILEEIESIEERPIRELDEARVAYYVLKLERWVDERVGSERGLDDAVGDLALKQLRAITAAHKTPGVLRVGVADVMVEALPQKGLVSEARPTGQKRASDIGIADALGRVQDVTRASRHLPHIVILYNYADHEFASKLTATLRRDRITPWIDDVDMSAGMLLVSRITQAVRPVDCVIPTISAASVASTWVQHEMRAVIARSFGGRRVLVLPARIDNTALPDFLASQPFLDFHRNGWNLAYDDLVVAVSGCAGHTRTQESTQPGFHRPRPCKGTTGD